MEELTTVPTATAVAAAAAAKRKDLMDNIGSRLNSGAYNAAKNLKKNEKDLREKVKFFEKKEATGQLKDYMVPRLRLAKDLLVKIQGLKGEEPNVATAAAPLARPVTAVRTRVRPATVAATTAATAATAAAPTAAISLNSVNRARRGLTIKAPKATRFAKTLKLTRATKSLSPVKSVKTTTSRKRVNKEVIMNEHFMQAMNEFLPLPVLHDPFTGRQYAPEENPMPEIERAYDMLKEVRVKMQRRAGQLRSKAKTANKRRATAASRKKTVANAVPLISTTLASLPAATATTNQAAANSKPLGLLPF
jgi:hypothetical protein